MRGTVSSNLFVAETRLGTPVVRLAQLARLGFLTRALVGQPQGFLLYLLF